MQSEDSPDQSAALADNPRLVSTAAPEDIAVSPLSDAVAIDTQDQKEVSVPKAGKQRGIGVGLVGAPKTGKTSLALMIRNYRELIDPAQLAQTQHRIFTLQNTADNSVVRIGLRDTVGSTAQDVDSTVNRTSLRTGGGPDAIYSTAHAFWNGPCEIWFVCRMKSEDFEAATALRTKVYTEAKPNACHLVITHSEGLSKEMRDRMAVSLRKHAALEGFFAGDAKEESKVMFSGALFTSELKDPKLERFKARLDNVFEMRAELYDHMLNSKGRCHVSKMKAFRFINAKPMKALDVRDIDNQGISTVELLKHLEANTRKQEAQGPPAQQELAQAPAAAS